MKINECVEFGEFVRAIRIAHGLTARQVALSIQMLPSNFSKLEHGALLPPSEESRLRAMVDVLGIASGSPEEERFFDLAGRATESTPVDLASIISRNDAMPLLLRTIGKKRLSRQEIERLIEIVRGTNGANTAVQQE